MPLQRPRSDQGPIARLAAASIDWTRTRLRGPLTLNARGGRDGLPDLGGGLKAAIHYEGAPVHPATVDRTVADADIAPVRARLDETLPGLAGAVRDARVCLYTNSPDLHFVLDRHPEHANVWLASACSGHGFKFAPAIGEAIADLVGGTPRDDLAPFRLARFG